MFVVVQILNKSHNPGSRLLSVISHSSCLFVQNNHACCTPKMQFVDIKFVTVLLAMELNVYQLSSYIKKHLFKDIWQNFPPRTFKKFNGIICIQFANPQNLV